MPLTKDDKRAIAHIVRNCSRGAQVSLLGVKILLVLILINTCTARR